MALSPQYQSAEKGSPIWALDSSQSPSSSIQPVLGPISLQTEGIMIDPM
jgi:hypothetical protein